jgi:hypothetical protein
MRKATTRMSITAINVNRGCDDSSGVVRNWGTIDIQIS